MYVHKGAAEFLYRKMTVATYLGGGVLLLKWFLTIVLKD